MWEILTMKVFGIEAWIIGIIFLMFHLLVIECMNNTVSRTGRWIEEFFTELKKAIWKDNPYLPYIDTFGVTGMYIAVFIPLLYFLSRTGDFTLNKTIIHFTCYLAILWVVLYLQLTAWKWARNTAKKAVEVTS